MTLASYITTGRTTKPFGRVVIDGRELTPVVTPIAQSNPWAEPHWLSVRVTFAMGESEVGATPTADIEVTRIPTWVSRESKVKIYGGYNGLETLIFNGVVSVREWRLPGPSVLHCSGQSYYLSKPYEVTDRDLCGYTTSSAAAALLAAAGVVHYVVNMSSSHTICCATDLNPELGKISFNTLADGLAKVIGSEGGKVWEGPDGTVYVRDIYLLPAPAAWRSYNYVAGGNSRILDMSISDEEVDSTTTTKMVVKGATYKEDNGDGTTDTITVEVTCVWISSTLGGRALQEKSYSNDLICTLVWAGDACKRKLQELNSEIKTGKVTVQLDPQIFLSATISLTDPEFTGLNAERFMVVGYQHEMGIQGFFTTIDVRGGNLSSGTADVLPIPCFDFSIRRIGDPTFLLMLDASCSQDPDGSITNYAWADDEGNTANGMITTIAYDAAIFSGQEIEITLTVTDNMGQTAALTKTIKFPPYADTRGTVDVTTRVIMCAAGNTAMISLDGGESWVDKTPAGMGATGQFVSCAADKTQTYIAPAQVASYMFFGTTTGEVWRTGDGGTTWAKMFTVPGGSRVEALHVARDWPNEVVAAFFTSGEVWGSANNGESGSWNFWHNFGCTVRRVKVKPDDPNVIRVAGGNGGDPQNFLWENNGSFLDWVSLTGSLAGVVTAGYCNDFDSVAQDWDNIVIAIYGWGPGVYRTINKGITWVAAAGMPAGVNDIISVATGNIALPTKVAFRNGSLNVWVSVDEINWTEKIAALPSTPWHVISDLNVLPVGKGFPLVFWGACVGGVVKSYDDGELWGYIRPFGTVTWPAGAIGYQVELGAEVLVSRPAGEADIMYIAYPANLAGTEPVDARLVRHQSDLSWIEISNISDAPPSPAIFSPYKLFTIPNTTILLKTGWETNYTNRSGNDVLPLQRSSDEGITWNTVIDYCRDFALAADGKLYALRDEAEGTNNSSYDAKISLMRSEDNGISWVKIWESPLGGAGRYNSPVSITCDPGDANRILLACRDPVGAGLETFFSSDGGLSFTNNVISASVHSGLVTLVAITINGALLCGGVLHTPQNFRLWRSIDDGVTWTKVLDMQTDFPDSNNTNHARQLLPISGGFLLLMRQDLFLGNSEGTSWTRIAKDDDIASPQLGLGYTNYYGGVAYDVGKNLIYLGMRSSNYLNNNKRTIWRLLNNGASSWEDVTFNQLNDLSYSALCATQGLIVYRSPI